MGTSSPTANLVVMAGAIHAAALLDLKFGRSLIVNPIPAASNALKMAIRVFCIGAGGQILLNFPEASLRQSAFAR